MRQNPALPGHLLAIAHLRTLARGHGRRAARYTTGVRRASPVGRLR